MRPDVVKTGMLPSAGIVKFLRRSLQEFPIRALVVDPVMVSTSGDVLAGSSVLASYRCDKHKTPFSFVSLKWDELLPIADTVTPNLKEAAALLGGVLLESLVDMHSAAKSIQTFGPR